MVSFRQARPMTARTLEEIEALAAGATPGVWEVLDGSESAHCCFSKSIISRGHHYDNSILEILCGSDADASLVVNAPRLLAIAQEQRGAMNADEARTREAAMRVWGEHVRGCDTADAMADLIVRQRAEIARLRAEINGWQNDHPFPG